MSAAPRFVPSALKGDTLTARLSPEHFDYLHRGSGISAEIIAERGYFTVTSPAQLPHMPKSQQRGGIGIPVYQLGALYTAITRPDEPRREIRDDGKEKIIKYEWPAGTPLCLDLLPRYRAALHDTSIPLCITEGIKKTDAASSQPWGDRAVWISINGVWGWCRKNADGDRCLLPDFNDMKLRGRRVILIPDSDYDVNPHVKQAFDELATLLQARGAVVGRVRFPHANTKLGLDDAIIDGWTWAEIEQAIHWCDEHPESAALSESTEIQRLRRENERLHAHIQAIEATLGNKELHAGERLTLYYLTKELTAQRRQQPQPAADAPVLTRIWKIAEESGQKESAVGRHLRNFEQYGVLQRDVRRQLDRCTKQVKTELYIIPSPELDRPFHIKPNVPKNWGGRRERCAECGSENLIQRVTVACEDCGAIHTTTERRLHPLIVQAEGLAMTSTDTNLQERRAPIIQVEGSVAQGQAQAPDTSAIPTPYIDQDDRSVEQPTSRQRFPTVHDGRSAQPPKQVCRSGPFGVDDAAWRALQVLQADSFAAQGRHREAAFLRKIVGEGP